MFAHREVRAGVGVAITDRHGGVSVPPYDSLNLADRVGDDPKAVAENQNRVLRALGPTAVSLVVMRQMHGADVAVVRDIPESRPQVDVIVTCTPGLVLAAMAADCTPVLLYDADARVVGAAHAGRRGLAAGTVPAAVEALRSAGAERGRIVAVVGPSICPDHYEVPEALRAEVASVVPASSATTATGAPALDVRAGIVAQLGAAGVADCVVLPGCTAESPAYYSFRRDGVTGRFAGLVWLEP